jgi:GT2 family glycosyltransferase
MTGISVVIPTWNGLYLLKQFLPSVLDACRLSLRTNPRRIQLLIVDDASDDATSEWLVSEGFRIVQRDSGPPQAPQMPPVRLPDLEFIRNDCNVGFGASCNRGFRQASHNLILLLNNDVKISPDAIDVLARHFDDAQTFAAHCRVSDMKSGRLVGTGKLASFSRGFIRVHGSYVDSPEPGAGLDRRLYSAFASGGAAMYDRSKFELLGGFDELLSPYYWEDVELSYRAWKRGYKIVYEPAAGAVHQISSTIGKLDQRPVKIIQQRNRLIFQWVNLHDRFLLASHLMWLVLLALTAPIRLQPWFLVSCAKALSLLPAVMARRKQEKLAATLSDRAVFEIFDRLRLRTDIIVYDTYQELIERDLVPPR